MTVHLTKRMPKTSRLCDEVWNKYEEPDKSQLFFNFLKTLVPHLRNTEFYDELIRSIQCLLKMLRWTESGRQSQMCISVEHRVQVWYKSKWNMLASQASKQPSHLHFLHWCWFCTYSMQLHIQTLQFLE